MTLRDREFMTSQLPRLDQFDFHPRLADVTGTALVMFTSPDCGACRQLRRVLGEVAVQQPDWQLFEVDVQADPGLAYEFEVFHLPTIFLFQDGEFHCQLGAEARTESIISTTRAALQRPAQEAP